MSHITFRVLTYNIHKGFNVGNRRFVLHQICKFGCFTSYHTWGVKIAAASMGVTLYVLLLGGSALPFRIAAVICLLAALEEIALTLVLTEPVSNVRSIWDTRKRD